MSIIISGITLPFTEAKELAIEKGKSLLKNTTITSAVIVKKSVDARRKDRINFVYSVALEIDGDEESVVHRLKSPQIKVSKSSDLLLKHGDKPLANPPVIVGFGPAGMFAGLLLAREGYRPIILERGQSVEVREKDVQDFWETGRLKTESNVQFGEGGAGTFSDGKLTTRIGDPYCSFVLEELVKHGAPREILYNAKPHVGTDNLRGIVSSIRREIIALGGQLRFGEKPEGISFSADGSVVSVATKTGEIATNAVILAVGHSARDSFRMLENSGVIIQPKPFSVGVRIEHLQGDIDRMLYGAQAGNPLLPHGEYQLSHRANGRAVYTFCMCPGGVVVPAASSDGMLTTNGMSAYARAEANANSALVVSVDPTDFAKGVLGGISFQERLEKSAFAAGGGGYSAPIQTVGHFIKGVKGYSPNRIKPSYARGVVEGDFSRLFPSPIAEMLKIGLGNFDRKMSGFSADDVLLTGVESRTSSPLRIPRLPNLEAVGNPGLYPCGEGAGYAGGIMSAAVDGLRCGQAIIEAFKAG